MVLSLVTTYNSQNFKIDYWDFTSTMFAQRIDYDVLSVYLSDTKLAEHRSDMYYAGVILKIFCYLGICGITIYYINFEVYFVILQIS